MNIDYIPAKARGPDALEQAFATMVGERSQAFVVLGDSVPFNYRDQIGVMAARDRLPAIAPAREFAEAGLLLAYGPDLQDLFRRSADSSTRFSKVRSQPTCRSNNGPRLAALVRGPARHPPDPCSDGRRFSRQLISRHRDDQASALECPRYC
jgi:hypothetical protein